MCIRDRGQPLFRTKIIISNLAPSIIQAKNKFLGSDLYFKMMAKFLKQFTILIKINFEKN